MATAMGPPSQFDENIINSLEDAISRNVAIVLKEGRSERPVQRLSELVMSEASGWTAVQQQSMEPHVSAEVATELEVAARKAVLFVLRAKPASSSEALRALAEALNSNQSRPKSLSFSELPGLEDETASSPGSSPMMSRVSVHSRHTSPEARRSRASSGPPQKSLSTLAILRKAVHDPRHRLFQMLDPEVGAHLRLTLTNALSSRLTSPGRVGSQRCPHCAPSMRRRGKRPSRLCSRFRSRKVRS